MPTQRSHSLVGRDHEIGRLLALIDAAEQDDGGALVLRGEAGIGKSALLDHVERAASDRFRIIHASGSELEMELPFAALHQLSVSVLAHLAELSAAHRDALQVAFGLAESAPDPFRVGLPPSNCWPPQHRNVPCCASSTTSAGLTRRRRWSPSSSAPNPRAPTGPGALWRAPEHSSPARRMTTEGRSNS